MRAVKARTLAREPRSSCSIWALEAGRLEISSLRLVVFLVVFCCVADGAD